MHVSRSAPETSLYFPGAHRTQACTEVAPRVAENFPAAQGVHVATDVAPVVALKVPLAHGVHAAALVPVFHVPGGQGSHVLSAASSWYPALHALHTPEATLHLAHPGPPGDPSAPQEMQAGARARLYTGEALGSARDRTQGWHM